MRGVMGCVGRGGTGGFSYIMLMVSRQCPLSADPTNLEESRRNGDEGGGVRGRHGSSSSDDDGDEVYGKTQGSASQSMCRCSSCKASSAAISSGGTWIPQRLFRRARVGGGVTGSGVIGDVGGSGAGRGDVNSASNAVFARGGNAGRSDGGAGKSAIKLEMERVERE